MGHRQEASLSATCTPLLYAPWLNISYASYNPTLALEAAFRFGATGSLWLRNNLVANSVVSKDFGDLRWVQGAVDEVLILNLSAGLATNWNIFYVEV